MRSMEQIPDPRHRQNQTTAKLAGRPMKRLTQRSLRNQALHYLARYAASRYRVERFLQHRLAKAEADERADIGAEVIGPLLDDHAWALTKARSLARRGLSEAAIKSGLLNQGLEASAIAAAMDALEEDMGGDLARAWLYNWKSRLVPYRNTEERAERHQRDLAALARRGFSFEVARKVVDAAAVPHPCPHDDSPEDDPIYD